MLLLPFLERSKYSVFGRKPEYFGFSSQVGIYMKISFGKINSHARIPEPGPIMALVTPIPLVLQAGERVDLGTGLCVRVPEGYILSIQSSPALLVHKGLEVLGPIFVASGEEEELMIPLYNVGKAQLDLQPGMQICIAMLHQLESVEIEEFEVEKKKGGRMQVRPPKGDPFKFEVS